MLTSDPLILGVETATLGGSVCVARGDTVLATATGDPKLSHSNTLLSDLRACLSQAKVSLNDIELFAAASGPGSFTGLRIGLATIKGLAATMGSPCVGIPTLHAVGHAAGDSTATVALLPAGRGEVFVQLLAVSGAEVIELDEPAHLSPERAIERYASRETIKWAGSGAHANQALIRERAGPLGNRFNVSAAASYAVLMGWSLTPEQCNLASDVAIIANLRSQRGTPGTAEALTAVYVRPSDAELKWK